MLDLGDPRLGDAEGVGEFRLGHARGLAHLGELVAANERLAALTGSGLTGGALGVGTRVELSRLGLDVGPLDVFGAHRWSSSFSAIRCSAYRSSASGIALRYQPSQLPDLSPATRKMASRVRSKANRMRISLGPDDGGRSSFIWWYRLPWMRLTRGRQALGPRRRGGRSCPRCCRPCQGRCGRARGTNARLPGAG